MKTIDIIEPIGKGFERRIMAELEEANGDDVMVNINCIGGLVKETLGVCNRLSEYSGKVTANITGIAASCASWIPAFCDHVTIRKNASLMIHNATGGANGDYRDLEKASRDLKTVSEQIAGMLHEKTGMAIDTILDYMGKETYFNAQDAMRLGFVDEILDTKAVSFRNLEGFEAIANKLPAEAVSELVPKERIDEIENKIRLQKEANERLRLRLRMNPR